MHISQLYFIQDSQYEKKMYITDCDDGQKIPYFFSNLYNYWRKKQQRTEDHMPSVRQSRTYFTLEFFSSRSNVKYEAELWSRLVQNVPSTINQKLLTHIS